jgi:hypothetical protein
MRSGQRVCLRLSMFVAVVIGTSACADEREGACQLTLADLGQYQLALTGKRTANAAKPGDSPIQVSFKDLWEETEGIRGRRVTVAGRVQRIFHQGPVGSFPALAEVWITSPAGDPFCLVVPHENDPSKLSTINLRYPASNIVRAVPECGQSVRFTGTFLKMVRYIASDGARLAPLIVGDQPPILVREADRKPRTTSSRIYEHENRAHRGANFPKHNAWSMETYVFALIVLGLVIGTFFWQHLRHASRRVMPNDCQYTGMSVVPQSPPEFIDQQCNR